MRDGTEKMMIGIDDLVGRELAGRRRLRRQCRLYRRRRHGLCPGSAAATANTIPMTLPNTSPKVKSTWSQ
jgi:hypothetical protein